MEITSQISKQLVPSISSMMGQGNSSTIEDMPEYNYSPFDVASSSQDSSPLPSHENEGRDMNTFQRKWTLFLYSITTILLFSDQNLLAPNLTEAAEEFGFDENERDQKLGGNIALAFFVLGAPASFLVGCYADSDSISRSKLFGIIVLIGEGACFLTYFTKTYAGLYVTRALTGFSVGGALPLLSSVLGDWYKPEERSKVMASVGIGSGLGIAFGQGVAGYIGPIYGWRVPFLIVSIPALFVAILVMTTVQDPVRGGSELGQNQIENAMNDTVIQTSVNSTGLEARHEIENNSSLIQRKKSEDSFDDTGNNNNIELVGNPSNDDNLEGGDKQVRRCNSCQLLSPSFYAPHWKTTKQLLSTKTVLLSLLQGAPGCIPWGIVNTFLNDYLSQDCGMTIPQATTVVLFFGFGNFLGMVIGGTGGDFLYKKNVRYPSILSGSMAILGCFPFWILLNTTKIRDDNISLGLEIRILTTAVLAGIGSGVTGPIVKATLQNITLPHSRGQAFALLNTFDDFGRGLGPVFVAGLIISLGGRQIAFNVGVGGWIICGILNLCIYFTVANDEAKAKSIFAERYSRMTRVADR